MNGYVVDIEDLTNKNADFRHVLYMQQHLQLVLTVLKPWQDIGFDTHAAHDQFFPIKKDHCRRVNDGATIPVVGSDAVIVPASAQNTLKNTGAKTSRHYSLYGRSAMSTNWCRPRSPKPSHEVFDGVMTELPVPHLVVTHP